MKHHLLQVLGVVACALLPAIPMAAAGQSAAPAHKAPASAKTVRTAWPPETITGKILKVDPAQKLLILQDHSGVTFDMRVTRSTRIQSGDQKLVLDKLASDTNKTVSVKFIPERFGDIARSVRITG